MAADKFHTFGAPTPADRSARDRTDDSHPKPGPSEHRQTASEIPTPADRAARRSARARPTGPIERFGKNVYLARKVAGLSQRAVALRGGFNAQEIGLFEKGGRNPRIFGLIRLAAALEADVGVLFKGLMDWKPRPFSPLPPDDAPSWQPWWSDLIRLWDEGKSDREIADACGVRLGTIGATITMLRNRGEVIPYRRPPVSPTQRAARARRARGDLTAPDGANHAPDQNDDNGRDDPQTEAAHPDPDTPTNGQPHIDRVLDLDPLAAATDLDLASGLDLAALGDDGDLDPTPSTDHIEGSHQLSAPEAEDL